MLLQRTGYAVTLMTNTGLKHDGKNPAGAPSTLYSHNVRIDERLFDLWANARGFTCRNGSHVPGLLYHHALARSEEHTSELQSLMRISYAVFCLKNKTQKHNTYNTKN